MGIEKGNIETGSISGGEHMCRDQSKCWKTVIRIGLILVSIAIILKVYYELKLLDLAMGIFKLEKGKKDIAGVSQKSLMYIVRNGTSDEVFFDKMAEMGWSFVQAYGRGYLFERDGEEVLATKRHHFKYAIYEIQNKAYFLSKVDKLA